MEAFIERHRPLITSTIYMVTMVLLAGYTLYYKNLTVGIQDLKLVTSQIKDDWNAPLAEQKKAIEDHEKKMQEKKKSGDAFTERIHSLPDFLNRINMLAKKNNVIIESLMPAGDAKLTFTLQMVVDYFTFLRFTADLESLDTIIHDLQVHPYRVDADRPERTIHAISFSLTPKNDAVPLAKFERLQELRSQVDQKNKRNPFQRFAYDATHKKVRPEIDLTWIHKLSGLGRNRDGVPYATIDRREYYQGDQLSGKKLVELQKDRVFLEKTSKDGTQRYVLKFRRR